MTPTVRRAVSPDQVEDAFDVRRDVFIDEQGVDEAIEMDGKDDQATHFVAYDDDGRAVGTARFRTVDDGPGSEDRPGSDDGSAPGHGPGSDDGSPSDHGLASDPDRVGKVERVAVREPARGSGIGRAMVEALESWAVDRGIDRLKLHSQTRVEGFYAKLGYETTGDVFQEAGIDHVPMEKSLAPADAATSESDPSS